MIKLFTKAASQSNFTQYLHHLQIDEEHHLLNTSTPLTHSNTYITNITKKSEHRGSN